MRLQLLALVLQAAQQGSASQSPAAVTATTVPSSRVQLRPAAEGQRRRVIFENAKGAIIFKVMISGREAWALLDNGFSSSVVDVDFAREAKLNPRLVSNGLTPTGQTALYRTGSLVFSVPGQVDIDAPEFKAIDLAPISAAVGRKIDAVLGGELFGMSAIIIDFENRWFGFATSGRPVITHGSDWVSVPLRRSGYQAIIEARISDKPVQLELDLGRIGGLLLQPAVWKRLALPERRVGSSNTISADGRSLMTKTVRVRDLTIGTTIIENPLISISPWRGEVDGVIGPDAVRSRAMIIDLPAGKLMFRPQVRSAAKPAP